MGTHEADTPDGSEADSERITGPLPERIARALTYLRVSPLNPTPSRKNGGGRYDYPSYTVCGGGRRGCSSRSREAG